MIKKIAFTIMLFVFVSMNVNSQNQEKIDSLVGVANRSVIDTNLVDTYEKITRLYLRIQLDSVKIYAKKMIKLAKKLDYEKGIAMGNHWFGQAYFSQGDYENALVYFKKTNEIFGRSGENLSWARSLQSMANVYSMTDNDDSAFMLYDKARYFFESKNDILEESKILLNIAILYSRKGNYPDAAKYLYTARFNFKSLNNNYWYILTEQSLANIYGRQERFDSAISIYHRVIGHYESVEDYYNLGEAYSNVGVLYEGLNNFDLALEAHKKGLTYRSLANDPRGQAVSEMNIGSLYMNMEKYDSVLYYLESSIDFFEEHNDMDPLAFNLLLTGNYYLKNNQPKKAVDIYQKTYKIAQDYNLKDDMSEALHGLSIAYEEIQDFENALKFSKLYKMQYDSLINEENIRDQTVAEEEYKYKLQLLEKEKVIEGERQEKEYLIIIGVTIVVFLIIVILYRRNLQKSRMYHVEQQNQIDIQKARLQSQKDERKRVANILHDNLAHVIQNTLSQVRGLVNKKGEGSTKQTLLNVEENLDFMNKLAKVASYELAFSYVLESNLIDQIDSYIKRIQHSHSPKISFQHSNTEQFENLPDEIKINVFSVFQEMIGNAIKYAKAEHIGITLFWDGEKTVLQVDDDGIGFNYEEERHGQGFVNMEDRASKLNGVFSYESDLGFGSKLKFVV